ncbi:hypothetical protein BC939DRAFT_456464 [Gamsiella multidivaricata]|uniref:uncharacterized protein n=1 Tax=Gamsiella multidivaricata TaxID=101098 RepID=UPI0022200550|nr:uncharacterized protein BC939DRAFT_456464 [Gamsiella multidivaricata]KAI7821082.1 hypothetical protein BC939DRAFT_456464 [Gamsiella multidivaricata]
MQRIPNTFFLHLSFAFSLLTPLRLALSIRLIVPPIPPIPPLACPCTHTFPSHLVLLHKYLNFHLPPFDNSPPYHIVPHRQRSPVSAPSSTQRPLPFVHRTLPLPNNTTVHPHRT